MRKRIFSGLSAFCMIASACFMSDTAVAETQSIKVGGDISAHYIKNHAMSFTSSPIDSDASFLTQARLYVEADLTDNVKTYVRVLNQREWDSADNIGSSISEDDIDLDLAYVQISEFMYSPLTLTIGRQEIVWGSGLVIADGIPNPSPNSSIDNAWYGLEAGFDAIRGQIDLDTVRFDMFVAQTKEDKPFSANKNDTTLTNGDIAAAIAGLDKDNNNDGMIYGLSASRVLPSEVVLSGYVTLEVDEGIQTQDAFTEVTPATTPVTYTFTGANDLGKDEIYTLGGRIEGPLYSVDPRLSFEAELAYQWGDETVYDADNAAFKAVDRASWAAIIGGSYSFEHPYKPVVSLHYDYRSGDDDSEDDKNQAWSAPHYARGIGNLIDQIANRYANDYDDDNLATFGTGSTNIKAFTGSASFTPFADVEVELSLVYAELDKTVDADVDFIEVIGSLSYDYTEDVTFSFRGSLLDPEGTTPGLKNDENAYEFLSSVVVEF
ncbi:hypothetical protein AB834_06705 [PVC group bacterium (ex Bugula neritina AB1)]|nr:hypothetical protein AB834_06705 [PVC group bacterium (ex Bugula neritina AB1)]